MTFTKQDAVTFGIGLGVAVLLSLGESLVMLDATTDLAVWGRNLLVGFGTSLGRYVVTYFTQRGIQGA